MTNFEKLQSMTLSELASYLCERYSTCQDCPMLNKPYCFRQWLQMVAETEE